MQWSVAETGAADVRTVLVLVEPLQQVRDVSAVVALPALEEVLLPNLLAADLADLRQLLVGMPVRYLLLRHVHHPQEAVRPATTLLLQFLNNTILFGVELVGLQPLQLLVFGGELQSLFELGVVFAEEGELVGEVGDGFEIAVLVEVGLDYLLDLLLLVLGGGVGGVEEDVVETGEAAETVLEFVAEVLPLLLAQQFGGEVEAVRQLEVQTQQQVVVVLVGRQVVRLLVAFVAQEQEAELQVAVFRPDYVVVREFDQEVQVDLQALHPLRQRADLPELGLGVVLEDVHERPHPAHAFRGLLDLDLVSGSPHEVLSEGLVLVGQQRGHGFEAHDDVLQRGHLRRHLEAADQLQRLVPAQQQQFVEEIGSLLLGGRLVAGVLLVAEPVVEVEGAGGFGVDGVGSSAFLDAVHLVHHMRGLELLDGLLVAVLEVVVLLEGEAAFPPAQVLHQQLPLLLIEQLVVAQLRQVPHHHAFLLLLLLLLLLLDEVAGGGEAALLREGLDHKNYGCSRKRKIYQGEWERQVPESSELCSISRIMRACISAYSFSRASSSRFSCSSRALSARFFSSCPFEDISSKKYLSLLDSYFSFPRFSSSFRTSPVISSFFCPRSRLPSPFLTVSATSSLCSVMCRLGLSKEIDFFRMDLSCGCGRLDCMEATICAMRCSRGLEMGAISERLKAPMILMISGRLASVWLRRSSRTYSSRQLARILKSSIFSLMRSPRSTEDCLRLVTVELPLSLDSSMFLVRLMTLTVCLPFLAFRGSLGSPPTFLLRVLVSLEAELARCMETAKELRLSFLRMAEDSRSSVLTRWQLGVREGFWQSDPFFLCRGSNCWLMDCWCEKERLFGCPSEILMRWIDISNILLNFITPPPHYQHSQKMIHTSKKNLQASAKMHSQHGKPLKRSKSSEHVLPKRTAKRLQDRSGSEQVQHSHSLTKSKSTKSLKPKSKHTPKPSGSVHKKAKGKKSSECKTVKKLPLREWNEVSSILTEEWEPKKPMLEYFVYQNNYIAIENSAQRRLVYKIQMIDLENKSTTSSFAPKKSEPKAVGTDTVLTAETAVNAVQTASHGETQTDPIPEPVKKFQETAAKCFADVLTELEFLFLPNEDNFKPFTQNERVHYGELLEVLAKKMLEGGRQIVEEALTEEQITVLLFQREGIQMGALEFIPLEGFPTHVLSILAYLKNLFCFVEYGFKEEVLAGLRHFYGFNYNERIARLSRGHPHEKDMRLALSEELFQAFEHQMFKDYEFHSPIAKDAVHAHNRAIFDSVNNELQAFRPFYSSQGQPFPWTNNLGMTHYDITEQALYIIFVQVKDKIQRQVSTLCGMHLDFDDDSIPRAENSQLYQKKMQQRQQKMLFEEAKQWDDRIQLDYYNSSLMFSLSQDILEALVLQASAEVGWLYEATDEEEFEFQYFN